MFRTGNKVDVAAVMRQIAHSRRRGHGIRYQDWHLELPAAHDMSALVDSMLSWCKITLGNCRRPYGIDLFDLIVAYRVEEDARTQSFRLDKLKPMALYEDSLPATLAHRLSQAVTPWSTKLYISAAVFSWGDAAHEALPASRQ